MKSGFLLKNSTMEGYREGKISPVLQQSLKIERNIAKRILFTAVLFLMLCFTAFSQSIVTNKTYLTFDELNTSGTFTVTGTGLTEAIAIAAPAGYTVNPTSVASNATGVTVTVTFNATSEIKDFITLTSGSTVTKVRVIGTLNSTTYTPRYSSGNLITDPYFNSLTSYAGWGSRNITTDTTEVYSGSRSYKTSGACGGSLDFPLTGIVEANTTYILRAMVKTSGRYKFIVNGFGVTEDENLVLEINTNGAWEQKEYIFTSGTLRANQNLFFNSCEGLNGTVAYLDNYELYRVILNASPYNLKFVGAGSQTLNVTGQGLTDPITITAPDGFTVSPVSLPASSNISPVSVTFNGVAAKSGYIVLTSGGIKDSVLVEGSLTPTLSVVEKFLSFDDMYTEGTITVNAGNLPEVVTITAPDEFYVDPPQLPANTNNAVLSVTYNGPGEALGYITLTSGSLSAQVRVKGSLNETKFKPRYTSPNLIADPYMNSLSTYAGWGSRSITTDTTEVYSGSRSYKTTGGCGGSLDYSLTGKVESNTSYILRAMVNTTGRYKFIINGCDVNGSNNHFLEVTTNGEWEQKEFVFTTGTLAANQNIFFNSCEGFNGTKALVDNFELYKVNLVATPWALKFSGPSSKNIYVTGQELTNPITISAPSGFTVTPSTLLATSINTEVVVTFDGSAAKSGNIILTSGLYTDTVKVEGSLTPVLLATPGYLVMDELNNTDSIFVNSGNLNEVISIGSSTGFSTDPAQLEANVSNAKVNVVFNGLAETKGFITFSSGASKTTVRVIGALNSTKFTPLYESGNIISNPYFNSLTDFAGWGSRIITQDTTEIYSGSRSFKTIGGCGGSLDYSLTGKVMPNTRYILRAMAKTTGTFKFIVNGCDVNGSNDFFLDVNTGGVWQQVAFQFTTGNLAANQNIFFNSCEGYDGSLALLDNLELYPAPAVWASPNILTFSGAESKTFTATAVNLNTSVTITAPEGFSVSPATLASNASNEIVSVTYDGIASKSGYIYLTSGAVKDSVSVSGFVTGIADIKGSAEKVYMNNGKIRISFELSQAANMEFAVYNLQGVLLAKQKAKYNAGSNNITLNAPLKPGLYMVKVSKNGKSNSYKVVK